MNKMIRRLLGGLAVLTLGSSLATASTITWYNNIFVPGASGGATNSPQGTPNQYTVPFATTVEIPKFDQTTPTPLTTIYQLSSVQIVLNWAITGTVQIFNIDSSAHNFTNAVANIPLSLVGPDSTTVNDTATAGPTSGTANPGLNSFPGLLGSGSANNTVIGGGLSSYQGFGASTVTFNVNGGSGTYGGTESGGSGHLFFGGTADVGASVAVTYNYNEVPGSSPIPEPGTFMMFGSALIGVGCLVRRRKSA